MNTIDKIKMEQAIMDSETKDDFGRVIEPPPMTTAEMVADMVEPDGMGYIQLKTPDAEGNGGRTRVQYDLPPKAEQLQDLIEYRNMNFAKGEMFKSLYRGDTCEHSGDLREARKVLWFAQREVNRLERGK